MGSQQTSTTNQTQTQTANPVTANVVGSLLPQALNTAATPYNQGMNQNIAGQNAQQLQAIQGLGGLQSNNPSSQYIQQANQYSQQAADPNSVLQMQQQFYNPMSQQVMAQLGNVFGQQNAQLLGNEAASGAIGGSRAGVAAGNLANQQTLGAGQVLSGLQQQALNAAQTQQGQISQQAFTQGQLGNEALNTQLGGINAALQGGNQLQQQQQAQNTAATQNQIQQTLFPQQELSTALNQAGAGAVLGGTTTGQGTTSTPVNYANMVGGLASLGAGLMAADGGAIRKHRAIGGGTGVGLGGFQDGGISGFAGVPNPSSSGLNYNGIQSPLSAYFAQSPQVNTPHANFPTLNLGGGGQNPAQSQPFSDPKQMQALGQSLGTMGNAADTYFNADFGGDGADFAANGGRIHRQAGGPVSSAFPQSISDAIQKHPDATSIKQSPDGGHQVVLQNGASIKYPGQKQEKTAANAGPIKHRDDGGPVEQDLTATPSPIQDFLDRRTHRVPASLGAASLPDPNATPETIASVNPAQAGPSDLERFLNERRSASLHASPTDYGAPASASTMGAQSAIPGPGAYFELDNQGRRIGAPQKPIQDRLAPPPGKDTSRLDSTPPPIQQAAIASPAETPPPVASPNKAAPGNQQPQWGTPEWRDWADGYGRVSIQGETGHTSAFQGLGEINTHDTNGSHSYGNYGLNSGGSAQEFVHQYGLASIGLTAQPGTGQFDSQWRQAASNPATANVLRRAEIDYYNNHYVNPTVKGMSQYLPVNIANSRAAQEYLIDKSVQQGTGTWDGNSRLGVKHIQRAQQAAEESGGDPVKFVNRMAELDHAAVGSDFPAALHSGAYSPLGDLNRLKTRVAGALGELGEGIQALPGQIGEGIRNVFGGGNQQGASRSALDRSDLQPPKPGESALDQRMAEFGFKPNQPQGLGGALRGVFGLGPSSNQRLSNALVNGGLGALAQGPTVGIGGPAGAFISLGKGIGAGGQFALNQEQQERTQAINLANAALNQQLHGVQAAHTQQQMQKERLPEWKQIGSEEFYNPDTGQHTYRSKYGWVDPWTKQLIPEDEAQKLGLPAPGATPGEATPGVSQSPAQKTEAMRKGYEELEAAPDLKGQPYLDKLKTIDPMRARRVDAILRGDAPLPTSKDMTSRNSVAMRDFDAAERASNGTVSAQTYPNILGIKKDFLVSQSANNIKSGNQAVDHMYDQYKSIPFLGNTRSETFNTATSGISQPFSKSYRDARKAYNTTTEGLSGEFAKFFKGNGVSAEKEIEAWKKDANVDAPADSQYNYLFAAGQMMQGQAKAAAEKYNSAFRNPHTGEYLPGFTPKTSDDFMPKEGLDQFKKMMSALEWYDPQHRAIYGDPPKPGQEAINTLLERSKTNPNKEILTFDSHYGAGAAMNIINNKKNTTSINTPQTP